MERKGLVYKRSKVGRSLNRTAILFCTLLFLGLMLSPLSGAADDELKESSDVGGGAELPPIRIESIQGVDLLGGGDFIGLINEDKDAMIGVIYGTEENPNRITIISIFTRYIGCADVYDQRGELLRADRGIPIRTTIAQSFESIIEFEDSDGDDLLDFRRGFGRFNQSDSVFKTVSLDTAWELSEVEDIEESNENGTLKTWGFSLSAYDLPYRETMSDRNDVTRGALEEVTLTFHFTAHRNDVRAENVPVYNVTVDVENDGEVDVANVERIGERSYRGAALNSWIKYDHYINGWDYDPDNGDPHLFMGTQLLMGNYISNALADWISEQLISEELRGDGSARYEEEGRGETELMAKNFESADGDKVDIDSMRMGERPRHVNKNQLRFDDNWQQIGRITWVSDVQVDGNEDRMYFQLIGGRSGIVSRNNVTFKGMFIVGGFSYPGGSEIFHDPQFESQALTLQVESASNSDYEVLVDDDGGNGGGRAIFAMIAVSVIIVMILTLIVKGRTPGDRRSAYRGSRYNDSAAELEDEKEYYEHYLVDKDVPKGKK